ncbi:MAG: hypothetical protein HGA43_14945 [Nitrospirae bacterium]|nr:hypothetical protein [Nitrospirota bacterium]
MTTARLVPAILFFALILLVCRESQAVIYKYVNAKDVPTFTDDLQKIPEQYRAQAVVVSGGNDYDAYTELEKARLAAEARTRQEQQAAASVKAVEPVSSRLIRSGIAVGLFIAIMFVLSNIHGLQGQAQVLLRIRAAMALILLVFLGITHAKDVMGFFRKVGDTVSNPVADIQVKSAERGRKAAQAYKALNRALDQRAQEEEARLKEIEKKADDSEQGK